MNSIPLGYGGLINTFRKPMQLRELFAEYLQAEGRAGKIDQSKTLAQFVDFDEQTVGASTGTFQFFGTRSSRQFIYPNSEHFVILGIKVYTATAVPDWNPGVNIPEFKEARMDIKNNGTDMMDEYPLTQAVATADIDTEPGWIWLTRPIVHLAETEFNLSIVVDTAPAAGEAIRFERFGLKLI